jgi:ribonucleases P/MRP protein subunit RPP40
VPLLKPSTDLISDGEKTSFQDFAAEIYEWLSLVKLESPRVLVSGQVDSNVSRYHVPGAADQIRPSNIAKLSWQGFITSRWTQSILMETLFSLPSKTWFSISMTSFPSGMPADSTEVTFLRPQESPGEYLLWELKKNE